MIWTNYVPVFIEKYFLIAYYQVSRKHAFKTRSHLQEEMGE